MDTTPTYNTLANRRLRSLDRDYIEGLFNIKLIDGVNEKIPTKFPDINESHCYCRKLADDITNYKIISNPSESQCIQCAICRNQLADACTQCQTPCIVIGSKICIHEFHYHCIRNWLTAHDVCPICGREWLLTNEMKIMVNFESGNTSFSTENKNKTEIIAEIYRHFNTDATRYVLVKNGTIIDTETHELKQGNYSLCTPDSHSNGNCIEIHLKKDTVVKKFYAKYTMTLTELKSAIATMFNIFSEELAIYYNNLELSPDFNNLNIYNIGLRNESEIVVRDDNPVNYCIAITNDHAVIYANCGTTILDTESNFKNNLRAILAGRKSWNPYPYIPNVALADISNLLSSLYVLTSFVNKKESVIVDVVKRFEKYLELYKMPTFPKISLELLLQVDISKFTDMHRTILSVTFYELINAMRIMCPNVKITTTPLMNSNMLCDLLASSDEPNIVNWEFARKKLRLQKIFNILSPVAINNSQPPVLTMNEHGQVVLYMGRGKEITAAATIYNPLSNSESDVDLAELGKKLSDCNILAEDDRVFQEAIMVCIDTSNSMSACSDFQEDKSVKSQEKQKFIEKYYSVWNNAMVIHPPYILSDIDTRKLKNAIIWFVTHDCFQYWQRDASSLREIVVVENNEYPIIAEYISRFRNIFKHILKFGKFRLFNNNYKCNHKIRTDKRESQQDNAFRIRMDDGKDIKYPGGTNDNLYDVVYYLHKYHNFRTARYALKQTRYTFGSVPLETELSKLSGEINLCWNSERNIKVSIYHELSGYPKRVLNVNIGTKIKDIIYKYNHYEYDKCVVYSEAKESGDGYFSGHKLRYESKISEDTDLYFFNWNYAESISDKTTYLSRLDVVKKLFDAFVDRSIAYAFNTAIGLMSFDNRSNKICDITAYYETFREKVNSLETDGATALYDCIMDTANHLVSWQRADPDKRSSAKLRIICLSDGADTHSQIKNSGTISDKLKQKSITFDAIFIGTEYDRNLTVLSGKTGGYIFNPVSIKTALNMVELETMISSINRAPIIGYNMINENSLPAMQTPKQQIMAKCMTTKAITNFVNDANNITAVIMREYKNIVERPHPDIDVYINENDVTFWKVVFRGPDGTPYAGGCWLAYIKFPENYPLNPPEMRMVTPIKHCNINNYGRICHSIFDRNYVPTVRIALILECVYGLLLNPDISDPLDTNLAMLFYEANGEYEATIMKHAEMHANMSRKYWRNLFTV